MPELGTLKAKHIPLVLLTSNNAREMTDALKRRCLHLYIDFPRRRRELAILRHHLPELHERLGRAIVGAVRRLRALDLRKPPSIAEALDWARALLLLGADSVEPRLLGETLNVLLKYQADIARAKEQLAEIAGSALPDQSLSK